MTAKGNGIPQNPAQDAAQVRADLADAVSATAADDLKRRAQERAVQAKDTFVEQAGHVVQATRDKVGQTKEKVSDLASTEDGAPTITSPPAVRGAGVATAGVAAVVALWMLRRRARRNANPWRAAAKTAKSQIKTVRKEAKSGLKTARKRSRAEAVQQVASAKAKARKAQARAKSWT